jgi:hypothetical protein
VEIASAVNNVFMIIFCIRSRHLLKAPAKPATVRCLSEYQNQDDDEQNEAKPAAADIDRAAQNRRE